LAGLADKPKTGVEEAGTPFHLVSVEELYQKAASRAKADLKGAATGIALCELIAASLASVAGTEMVELKSNVPGKEYTMARRGKRTSRPINRALFAPDIPQLELLHTVFHPVAAAKESAFLERCLYTAAMSYPLANDLEKDGDKKSPGTFFEMLIGHIVAARFGLNPIRQIMIPTLDEKVTIPTDFIFELGQNRRVHLPIKISTRERVVQVWAHQAMLDGMHGDGRFKGIMVCLTETNKQKNVSVAEVCLPNQWRAYQMYIAKLSRVYYLDVPVKYAALRENYPHIQVWPLSHFFQEADNLFDAQGA
jgi:hypothetical protein